MVDDQKPNPQDQKPDPVIPLEPIKPASNGNTDKPAGSTEESNHPKKPLWEKHIRNWLMVGFTGTLALYTAWLYTVAVKQTDIVKTYSDAAKISAEAALKGATAAENANTLSKQMADRQERFAKIEVRPYVNIKLVNAPDLKIGDTIAIDMQWINSGRTPAYLVGVRDLLKIGTGIYQNEIKQLEKERAKELDRKTIGSNLTFTRTITMVVWTRQDSILVYSKKRSLFIAGTVFYTDKFSDVHSTSWSFRYSTAERVWRSYPLYNDAN